MIKNSLELGEKWLSFSCTNIFVYYYKGLEHFTTKKII